MRPDAFSRFLGALRSDAQRRVRLERLRIHFAHACPELAEQADRRDHLAGLIQLGAARGEWVLPRGPKSWDRSGAAPLPTFIALNRTSPERPTHTSGYAWHPLLAFATRESNARRLKTLRRINEWLKSDPDLRYSVPIKERSLDIFDDEKRLDQLRAGQAHFFDGQLMLENLACRICPIPLPYELGPPQTQGYPILIVENNDTWESFCVWNRSAEKFAAIAYGGGGHAKGILYDEIFLDTLLERCDSRALLYLGDLDPRGLRIAAATAARRAARRAIPLSPAVTFYDWLLARGRRVLAESRERPRAAYLAWLPERLRVPVAELFAARQRIPQESLGTRALRGWSPERDGPIPGNRNCGSETFAPDAADSNGTSVLFTRTKAVSTDDW